MNGMTDNKPGEIRTIRTSLNLGYRTTHEHCADCDFLESDNCCLVFGDLIYDWEVDDSNRSSICISAEKEPDYYDNREMIPRGSREENDA